MAVLGIVPARGGSRRIKRKNLSLLAGKPLVQWAIEAALIATRIDRLVVSSDDAEVLAIARAIDHSLPLERPAELATDNALAVAYVRHAVTVIEAAGGGPLDAIVIVQPTSPFTLPEDIDATVDLLLRSGADSAVSVVRLDHAIHPAKLKRVEGDRLLPFYEDERGRMADHELPPVYVRNGSVYASRRATLDRGELLGPDCRAHVMPRERSLDINDPIDLALAEVMMRAK